MLNSYVEHSCVRLQFTSLFEVQNFYHTPLLVFSLVVTPLAQHSHRDSYIYLFILIAMLVIFALSTLNI